MRFYIIKFQQFDLAVLVQDPMMLCGINSQLLDHAIFQDQVSADCSCTLNDQVLQHSCGCTASSFSYLMMQFGAHGATMLSW